MFRVHLSHTAKSVTVTCSCRQQREDTTTPHHQAVPPLVGIVCGVVFNTYHYTYTHTVWTLKIWSLLMMHYLNTALQSLCQQTSVSSSEEECLGMTFVVRRSGSKMSDSSSDSSYHGFSSFFEHPDSPCKNNNSQWDTVKHYLSHPKVRHLILATALMKDCITQTPAVASTVQLQGKEISSLSTNWNDNYMDAIIMNC